jgi:hypothetical protein
VNYFGHAAVASWQSPSGAVVLGAMLPDFATMCGSRLADADDASIAAGIALHHATDAAFHRLPAVTGLMRELDLRLAELGCARGPRRAVAHIGVELILDGVLVADASYREAFLAGLAADPAGVRWRDATGPERFAVLLSRLREHGVPDDLRDATSVTYRLQRILGPRPLLAPSYDDVRAIRIALVEIAPRVAIACEAVLRGVRASLANVASNT